jgi:hypothetical protein
MNGHTVAASKAYRTVGDCHPKNLMLSISFIVIMKENFLNLNYTYTLRNFEKRGPLEKELHELEMKQRSQLKRKLVISLV